MERLTVRRAVDGWAIGFLTSLVIQGVFARVFSRATAWGHNPGWQREIAIWNLGTLATIVRLRRHPGDPDRAMAGGFAVLSGLFGLNHLVAGMRSPGSWGNWLGAAANVTGIGLAAAALAHEQADTRP
jgi:hypothetical protein